MISKLTVALALSAGCFLSTGVLAADQTLVLSEEFGELSDGIFADVDGQTVQVSNFASLSGFNKFDPALGTLNEVRFTIEVWANAEVTLESYDLLDPTELFSLHWQPGTTGATSLQTSIVYFPGGGSSGFAMTVDTGGFGDDIGDLDQDPSDWGADEASFYYFSGDSLDYGGFAGGGTTVTSGSLLATDPNFVENDFVGVGTVVGLEVLTSGEFDTSSIFLDNLSAANIQAFIFLEAGNATLEYVYTPIPEPAAVAFFAGAAALGLLLLRRRAKR